MDNGARDVIWLTGDGHHEGFYERCNEAHTFDDTEAFTDNASAGHKTHQLGKLRVVNKPHQLEMSKTVINDDIFAPHIPDAKPCAIVSTADASRVTPHDLAAASWSVDRFVITKKLGSGGMGEVFRAYDPRLRREVALKLLLGPDLLSDMRLLREAQAMARVSHPNILPLFDVGHCNRGLFIAMELVEGQNLRQRLRAKSARSWGQTYWLDVMQAAGRGLQAAHEAGLVHRDFKPSNVMLGDDGRVRVMDFGLACAGANELSVSEQEISPYPPMPSLFDESLTRPGDILGTPAYMSPEQHLGQVVDARSDQYSFCIVLWEALYGARPFQGKTRQALFEAKIKTTPSAPRHLRLPRPIHAALLRGLSIHPEDRFDSMGELLESLQQTRFERRRSRWLCDMAMATAVMGIAGLATGTVGAKVSPPVLRETINSLRVQLAHTQGVLDAKKDDARDPCQRDAWPEGEPTSARQGQRAVCSQGFATSALYRPRCTEKQKNIVQKQN